MIRKLAELVLRYRISRRESARERKFMSWEKIDRIALVVNSRDRIARHTIDSFISESRKFIEVFYVEVNRRAPTYADWQCFLKKHRSLFNLPGKSVSHELEKQRFDVVINTSSDTDIFSRSIAGLLSAPLKCSTAGFREVDLVIERPDHYGLDAYLHEVVRYLKMINVEK
jgi:hypothetical protein